MKPFQLLLLVFLAFPASAETTRPDTALEKSVADLATLLSDGYAVLDTAQLFPVRTPNAVAVIFNLQSPARGNGTWQFLAFFEENDILSPEFPVTSQYRLISFKQIGARGARLFDSTSAIFRRGKLSVVGSTYKRSDPMCCPSLPVRSIFSIQDGRIVEQSVAAN